MADKETRLSDEAVARMLDAARPPRPVKAGKASGWTLLVVGGPRQGQQFRLPASTAARMGRAADNWICFDRDEEGGVSQYHAELSAGVEGVKFRDLNSTNGSFVNGRRAAETVVLAEGDLLALGGADLRMMLVRT